MYARRRALSSQFNSNRCETVGIPRIPRRALGMESEAATKPKSSFGGNHAHGIGKFGMEREMLLA